MSENEHALFLSFLKKSKKYLEFGSGGSTFVAASHVKSWIISIDSSKQWLDKVRQACADKPVAPDLIFADIGATGGWGFPVDSTGQPRWHHYHSDIWSNPKSMDADLYFVDGRFRVACFAQIVLHCRPDALIGIHDFIIRPHYHVVHDIAREISSSENMSFFQPIFSKREESAAILEEYKNNPD